MMASLFPDLERQFELRAHDMVQKRRRRFHPSRALAIGVLGVALTSGVAYAAVALWQPTLGRDGDSRVAVAGAPAADVIASLQALQRPQSDSDRANESQFALTFPADRDAVRTNFVRSLGTTADGRALTLIPITNELDGNVGADDQLCLWADDATTRDSGSRQCGTLAELRAGELFIATAKNSQDLDKARDAYMQEFLRTHPNGGTLRYPPSLQRSREQFTLTALAPDGVASAQLQADGSRIPVIQNVIHGAVDTVPQHLQFFDASGAPYPAP